MSAPLKILIVDDSALVRQSLSRIIEADKSLEVIGVASDPFAAVRKIAQNKPDVITLDVEMPKMDGITFLRKIMSQHPIPVVIISSLTKKGSELAIKAMEYGAVDVVQKSNLSVDSFKDSEQYILDVIKAAGKSSIRRKKAAPIVEIKKPIVESISTTNKIIAVGASTGGTEAIRIFLEQMPIDCPGIVIVQHMPELFTTSFAERLNAILKINVKEAIDGDTILRGQVLIAPGNKHLEVRKTGTRYYVVLTDGDRVNRHKPSVDVLFYSVAKNAGKNATGVILTGMGADGAKGMLAMKNAGSFTIGQNENTCIVYGMPKEAKKLGGVCKELALTNIGIAALNSLNY